MSDVQSRRAFLGLSVAALVGAVVIGPEAFAGRGPRGRGRSASRRARVAQVRARRARSRSASRTRPASSRSQRRRATRGRRSVANQNLAPAKRVGTGRTVLGNYPGYIKQAGMRDRHFQVPARHWNRMSSVQQWRANRRFLDRTIARGDRVLLSANPKGPTNAFNQRAGSQRGYSYRREIAYMVNRGYRLHPNGKELIPPGR